MQAHPHSFTPSVHNTVIYVFVRGPIAFLSDPLIHLFMLQLSSCESATRWQTESGTKRKETGKVRGENGLCTGWRRIITAFLSLPRRAASPQPRKKKKSNSTRQQSAPASLWWREIYDHCHRDCVSTGHSTLWPSPSSAHGFSTQSAIGLTCTHAHTHTHTSSLPCFLPVLVIRSYQPSAARSVFLEKK